MMQHSGKGETPSSPVPPPALFFRYRVDKLSQSSCIIPYMAAPVAESDEQIKFDESWNAPDEEFEESPQDLDPTSSYPSDSPVEKAEEVPSESKPPETPAGKGEEGAGGTPPKEEPTPPAEGAPPPEEGAEAPTGTDPPKGSDEGTEQPKTVEQQLEALKTASAKELSDLRSEVGRLRREKRQPPATPPQPKAEEKPNQFDMAAIKENLKPLREADEEVASAIEKSFDAFGEQIKSRERKIDALEEKINQLSGDSADTQFFREVLKVHPDATGISESKEFSEWLDKQPNYVQDTARSGQSPDDAIHIITSYKSATAKAEKPKPEPAPEPPQETAEEKALKAARRSTGVMPIRQSNSGVKSTPKKKDSFDTGWDDPEPLDDDMAYGDQPHHISFGQ